MGLRARWLTTSLLALLWAGCTVESPGVITPGDDDLPNVSRYADAILGIGDGNHVEACFTAIPTCENGREPS